MRRQLYTSSFVAFGWRVDVCWDAIRWFHRAVKHRHQLYGFSFSPHRVWIYNVNTDAYDWGINLGPVVFRKLGHSVPFDVMHRHIDMPSMYRL